MKRLLSFLLAFLTGCCLLGRVAGTAFASGTGYDLRDSQYWGGRAFNRHYNQLEEDIKEGEQFFLLINGQWKSEDIASRAADNPELYDMGEQIYSIGYFLPNTSTSDESIVLNPAREEVFDLIAYTDREGYIVSLNYVAFRNVLNENSRTTYMLDYPEKIFRAVTGLSAEQILTALKEAAQSPGTPYNDGTATFMVSTTDQYYIYTLHLLPKAGVVRGALPTATPTLAPTPTPAPTPAPTPVTVTVPEDDIVLKAAHQCVGNVYQDHIAVRDNKNRFAVTVNEGLMGHQYAVFLEFDSSGQYYCAFVGYFDTTGQSASDIGYGVLEPSQYINVFKTKEEFSWGQEPWVYENEQRRWFGNNGSDIMSVNDLPPVLTYDEPQPTVYAPYGGYSSYGDYLSGNCTQIPYYDLYVNLDHSKDRHYHTDMTCSAITDPGAYNRNYTRITFEEVFSEYYRDLSACSVCNAPLRNGETYETATESAPKSQTETPAPDTDSFESHSFQTADVSVPYYMIYVNLDHSKDHHYHVDMNCEGISDPGSYNQNYTRITFEEVFSDTFRDLSACSICGAPLRDGEEYDKEAEIPSEAPVQSSSEPVDSPSEKIAFQVKTTKAANIRETANKHGKLLRKLSGAGILVDVIESIRGDDGKTWYKLLLDNDMIGYARSDFFADPIQKENEYYTDTYVGDGEPYYTSGSYPLPGITNRDKVNVRGEMDKNSALLTTIPKKGTSLTVITDFTGDDDMLWYQVEYNGITGFIRSDFILLQEPEGNSGNEDDVKGTDSALYGLAIKKLATRSAPSPYAEDTGTYFVEGQRIRIYSRAYDPNEDAWWVKCDIPYHGEIRTLWTWYTRFDSASLPLEKIPIEGSEFGQGLTNAQVNIWTEPSTNSEIEKRLPSGELVTIIDIVTGDDGNQWYKIDVNGYEFAYVLKEYIDTERINNAERKSVESLTVPSKETRMESNSQESSSSSGTKEEYVIDHYETVEVQKSRRIIDHYETYYTYTDNGDGTFVETPHERPVYTTEYYTETVQEPVYRKAGE